jgi:hypothetical protein
VPQRREVRGSGRKLHTEVVSWFAVLAKYYSGGQTRGIRGAGRVAGVEEMEKACTVLVGKAEGKRQLGRPELIWENSIKLDPNEIWER